MKKLLSILFLSMLMFSCQPERGNYNCTCDITTNGSNTPQATTLVDVSSDDAKVMCNDYGKNAAGSTGTYKCSTSLR